MEILVNNGTLAATLIGAGEYSTEYEIGGINNDGTSAVNNKRARSIYINKIASLPYVGVDKGSLDSSVVSIDLMSYDNNNTLVTRYTSGSAHWTTQNVLLESNAVKFRFSLKFSDERDISSSDLESLAANVKVVFSDSATRS